MYTIKYIFLSVIFLLLITAACFIQPTHSTPSPSLRIKGSDTMHLLMQNLAAEFVKQHPGITIETAGGGTAEGVKALIRGTVEICAASRLINPDEIRRIASKYRSVGVYSIIARDALSIYVHPRNPVRNLTTKQLKQIFSGEITNWREVGGENHIIQVYIRPPNSGTHLYFLEHILEYKPYSAKAKALESTEQIIQEINHDPLAIGYGGMAFGRPEFHIQVNGINPSADNVKYDLYPISRYLYLYTIHKPQGLGREFIDWIMSEEGQQIIKETGFLPLWNSP